MRLVAIVVGLVGAFHAAAAQSAVRVDTTLLARDLDGDGKTDFVVVESKRGPTPAPARLAVYLGATPGTVRAAWATEWDDALGDGITIDRTLPLDSTATFVQLGGAEGDYDATWLLLVERGQVRELLSHGIDYGDGFFLLHHEEGRFVVEATQPHLQIAHREVGRPLECADQQWPVVRLVFDRARGGFVAGEPRCERARETYSP